MLNELLSVIKMKNYASLFTAILLAVSLVYGYLLINSATGMIDFGSYYRYFDVASAIIISLLISWVITLNVYSYRSRSAKRDVKFTVSSIVSAILPSSLCCTSIVPSILAVSGLSTSFILGNTGKIQSIFSIYGPAFIAAGALIAFVGLMQITRNINSNCKIQARADKADDCCEVKYEDKD
ncbi:MAG: hypothetical protein OH316_01585 [Candidatus Parvarchaeota archaeon]|nr:hypothetical protein [Candidatus Parvarchaeota archaeon]